MSKELKDFTHLLIDIVRIGKKVKESSNAPSKMFDYFLNIKENFEKIEKFNKNDDLFDNADVEEQEQFSETLEKFLAYTEKHRLDEKSLLHPIFSHEKILLVLAGLDRRFEKLNG